MWQSKDIVNGERCSVYGVLAGNGLDVLDYLRLRRGVRGVVPSGVFAAGSRRSAAKEEPRGSERAKRTPTRLDP